MTIWLIEPRDPLIFRDGRPFGPTPGAIATSLPFPFPSTVAGGVRSHAGKNSDGVFTVNTDKNSEELRRLQELSLRGPLLVELPNETDETNGAQEVEDPRWLFPAPADALLFDDTDKKCKRVRLLPLESDEDEYTDLGKDLSLVGPRVSKSDKPMKKPPAFWYWDKFQEWLLHENEEDLAQPILTAELGHNGPQREQRVHVSIDSARHTGREGALFGTSGLEFTAIPDKIRHETRRLALAVSVDYDQGFTLNTGLDHFGGERRIVRWRRGPEKLPTCPNTIIQNILQPKEQKHFCRIILLTPTYFEHGYLPENFLKQEGTGVHITLKAIAIQRPQIVSGWDIVKVECKPTQLLAPAGTVLFLELQGNDESIETWITNTWMHNICDHEQMKRDGCGLAVVGTWSGELAKMHIK